VRFERETCEVSQKKKKLEDGESGGGEPTIQSDSSYGDIQNHHRCGQGGQLSRRGKEDKEGR